MGYNDNWSNEWANHDHLIDLNKKLKNLEAENVKLIECVEFYADKKSWDRGICIGDGQFEPIGDGPNGNYFGGKRARQVLKELEE